MKKCNFCKINKPLSLFSKDRSKNDGHHTICSECTSNKRKNKPKVIREVLNDGSKKCTGCKKEKQITSFGVSRTQIDGRAIYCRDCRKIKSKIHYAKNSDRIKKQTFDYFINNRDLVYKRARIYQKRKCKEDPFFLMKRRLRNRLYYALKNKLWKKKSNFTTYIGCDRDMLVNHIEARFVEGMTWDNYGTWHIDHIVPLDSAKNEEELYKLCHYTNLQPLWATDNIKKGCKV